MNNEEYSKVVWDLFKEEIRESEDATMYLLSKLVSEIAECFDCVDQSELSLELGDVMWYMTNLNTLYNINFHMAHEEGVYTYQPDNVAETLGGFLVHSSLLLGEVCKQRYHGKDIGDITKALERANEYAYYTSRFAGLELDDIRQANADKLFARHGKTYNSDFYTKG